MAIRRASGAALPWRAKCALTYSRLDFEASHENEIL